VADHNPTAIANAINSLLNSDSDRRRLSTNARSLARQAYSLEAMGLALSQLYHDVSPSAA
jgi:glycosyltransferase involved in cell wall biosynthesis